MMSTDLRPKLEAMAAGKTVEADRPALDLDLVKKHERSFEAWASFSRPRGGEHLNAPAALLVPLP